MEKQISRAKNYLRILNNISLKGNGSFIHTLNNHKQRAQHIAMGGFSAKPLLANESLNKVNEFIMEYLINLG